MRSLLRENPGIVFAEVPRRGAPGVAADTLVLMASGQVQPLWRDYAGHSDWRLLGVGLPNGGVYAPIARVERLGLTDSLPTFAGWRQAFGLKLAHAQTPSGPILPALLFTEDTAAIVLPPLPLGGELRGTLLGARGEALSVYWEPGSVTEGGTALDLQWQVTNASGHPFTLRLPPATEARRLYFKLPAGSRPVFTRLQLQDRLASP